MKEIKSFWISAHFSSEFLRCSKFNNTALDSRCLIFTAKYQRDCKYSLATICELRLNTERFAQLMIDNSDNYVDTHIIRTALGSFVTTDAKMFFFLPQLAFTYAPFAKVYRYVCRLHANSNKISPSRTQRKWQNKQILSLPLSKREKHPTWLFISDPKFVRGKEKVAFIRELRCEIFSSTIAAIIANETRAVAGSWRIIQSSLRCHWSQSRDAQQRTCYRTAFANV